MRLNGGLIVARSGRRLLALMLVAQIAVADNGYWQCADGRWSVVGVPGHASPVKECGAVRRLPDKEQACGEQGGKWGPVGIFPKPVCSLPTRDAGRTCADSGECEGLCLAELTPEERDRIKRNRGPNPAYSLTRNGRCSPRIPVIGCHAKVEQGTVRYIVCFD